MDPRVQIRHSDRPRAFEVLLEGRAQSYVDLDDPTELGFDYLCWMAAVIDVAAPSGQRLRVLHVGGGGLSLARYVTATRPTSPQVVLEPDSELVAAVRRDLPLPARSGIKVREVDGRAGLADLRDGYADLVLVDAFHDGVVPPDLISREGVDELGRVLAEGGLLALNVVDRAPFESARQICARLSSTGDGALGTPLACVESSTLRGRRAGNVVLVAGRGGRVPAAALRRRSSTSAVPYRVLEGWRTTPPG